MNATTDPILLGLMPPLSGLADIYGAEIVRAAQIARDEINAAGGVLGRPLELVIEDDGSLPQTAVPAAHRLVNAGCAAIIGNLLSNSRIAVDDHVAEPRGIPYLNFSFYEGSISGRHFFHFAALPNQQIDRMIPWMAREYGPKMIFAGNNYEWPRGSIDAAKRALLAAGGDVLGEEYLPIGCANDEIDALLDLVGRSGADVFVPYFAGADQIALLTRFTELGLKQRMAVVMGHYDEVMVSRLPSFVREGLYSSNTYFMSVDTPQNHAFLERLARHPGINGLWPAGNGLLSNFGEGTYLCVKAFAAAANAAGSLSADALVAALERVSIDGPQGRVTMDAATHNAHVNGYLARCRADGGFDIVECFGRMAPLIPVRFRQESVAAQRSPLPPKAADHLTAVAVAAVQSLGKARQIMTVADIALIACDVAGHIVEASPQAAEMFGYTQGELLGMSVHLLLPPHQRAAHANHMAGFLAGTDAIRRMRDRSEVTGYRKDGSFFPVEASIAKVRAGPGWLLVATLQDVSERKRVEEALVWKATHDALTGLPNRSLIRERLANALWRSRRQIESVALLFIDLDGFKAINDALGHEAGDELLKVVAQRLGEQVRPGDSVGRLAGDEFVVLCDRVEQPVMLATLAERLNDALRQPLTLANGHEIRVAASIGVAIGHGSTHAADDLLRNADTAMYAVKSRGRDSWQFFNESIEAEARQRVTILTGLRTALERDELSVRYQPIVAVNGRRVVGAEVLLRWTPPEGPVSPAVFVPLAESTGTIVPIGAWVFRQACQTAADWRARFGDDMPYVAVNVSARQLDVPDLAAKFAAILRDTGARPADLLIEITESALMSDIEVNLRTLQQIAEQGLRVAVDDFSTGYSSLSHLLRLPVSVLKVDRAFVNEIDTRQDSRVVATAIVRLGQTLGYRLVAEGVENEAQLAELRALGCDYAQGYLFDRPLELPSMLDAVMRSRGVDSATPDPPRLHYLIYASDASAGVDAVILEDIRRQAASFNGREGITSLLLYQRGCFMQMLEGDADRLAALMERIRRDPRHGNVRVLVEGPAAHRVFPDWTMSVRDLDEIERRLELGAFGGQRRFLVDISVDPVLAYAYITGFGQGNVTRHRVGSVSSLQEIAFGATDM
jgi:diguanylate cyclase (GGDEF)-like protein/PAS domain S-box-containing protein